MAGGRAEEELGSGKTCRGWKESGPKALSTPLEGLWTSFWEQWRVLIFPKQRKDTRIFKSGKSIEGYGLETCGRTIEYLVDDAEVLDRSTVEDWVDSCANRDNDETYYESILDEICEAAISVLDSNHDLFWTPNTKDSRMGKLQWIDDIQPLYDLEVTIPYEL